MYSCMIGPTWVHIQVVWVRHFFLVRQIAPDHNIDSTFKYIMLTTLNKKVLKFWTRVISESNKFARNPGTSLLNKITMICRELGNYFAKIIRKGIRWSHLKNEVHSRPGVGKNWLMFVLANELRCHPRNWSRWERTVKFCDGLGMPLSRVLSKSMWTDLTGNYRASLRSKKKIKNVAETNSIEFDICDIFQMSNLSKLYGFYPHDFVLDA